MTTSPDIVVLVGNPRPGSRTRAAGERLAGELDAASVQVVELAEVTGVSYSAEPAVPAAPDAGALERVCSAPLLIVGTPAYKGTYTGLLKLFLDRLPHEALAGVIAVPVAVAASPEHARATADDLERLLHTLGAQVRGKTAVLETEVYAADLAATAAEIVGHLDPVTER